MVKVPPLTFTNTPSMGSVNVSPLAGGAAGRVFPAAGGGAGAAAGGSASACSVEDGLAAGASGSVLVGSVPEILLLSSVFSGTADSPCGVGVDGVAFVFSIAFSMGT